MTPSSAPSSSPSLPPVERIAARRTELGEGFSIYRALPSRGRRLIGAWCFLDHAGPVQFAPGQALRVGPHPHIGLQTFTWMIEGEVVHRDSLGITQRIRPGQVNLMTAGRGIVHAEDSPDDAGGPLHLAQLWIALPDAVRGCAPEFAHYPTLPRTGLGGFALTVLVGQVLGEASPVVVHSPLIGLDLTADAPAACALPLDPDFEHGVLVLRGSATIAGESLHPGTLLYLPPGGGMLSVACAGPVQLLLIGGKPFDEPVVLWWNFVARTQAELEAATADWNAGRRFGEVVGSPSARLTAPAMNGVRLPAGA